MSDAPTETGYRAHLGDTWLDIAAGGVRKVRNAYERGRAGAGRLIEALVVEPGTVDLRVPDGRGRSHDVHVVVPILPDDEWDRVVRLVSEKVRHSAALLDGRLPPALAQAGSSLWPATITATCTCSEARPCRHEAAAHHAMAMSLDRDQLRLLRYRGRTADELISAVRVSRAPIAETSAAASVAGEEDDPFTSHGDLGAIAVHPEVPTRSTDVFERMGPPPGIEDTTTLEALMGRAAELAWRLAAGDGTEAADDEALLTELRAQGVATAAAIAASLGLDDDVAGAALDRLYDAGQVLRMGQGVAARYRAAG